MGLAVAGAFAVLVSPAAVPAALETPTPFSDPAGDVLGAPDITDVGVAHTAADGLTFTVRVANEPILLDRHVVELRLDTDMDVSTGASNGVDRLIHRPWLGRTVLCTWAGSGFSCSSSTTVTSTYVDGLLTVATTASALGIGDGFDLSVAGYGGSVDFAPDSGSSRFRTRSSATQRPRRERTSRSLRPPRTTRTQRRQSSACLPRAVCSRSERAQSPARPLTQQATARARRSM